MCYNPVSIPLWQLKVKPMTNRSSADWLAELRSPTNAESIAELRAILLRGLSAALGSRLNPGQTAVLEDFAQEAVLKVLANLDTFRGEAHFLTWAHKIAVRVAYSELRRQRWKDISLDDLLPADPGVDFTPAALADPSASPEQQTIRQNLLELVARMINEELTERQRQAMHAVLIKGVPMDQAAGLLNTNPNALYKLLHDARKRLDSRIRAQGLTPDEILAAFES